MEGQLEALLAATDELKKVDDLVVHANRLNHLTRQAELMLQLTAQPAC
jgi:hypothetical protein